MLLEIVAYLLDILYTNTDQALVLPDYFWANDPLKLFFFQKATIFNIGNIITKIVQKKNKTAFWQFHNLPKFPHILH